jgi:hypothetical protein
MRVPRLVHTEEMLAMMQLCSDPVPIVWAQKLDRCGKPLGYSTLLQTYNTVRTDGTVPVSLGRT